MKRRIKRFISNRNHLVILASVFIIILTTLFIKVSYSRYTSGVDVLVNSVSGEMICNIEIDTNDSYIENNIAYFRIIVRNTKNNVVTATDVDYTLTISNAEGSNGKFYYIDSLGNVSDEANTYYDTLTTDVYSFGKDSSEMVFKVYVKVDSKLADTVQFNVSLDAVQKEMG